MNVISCVSCSQNVWSSFFKMVSATYTRLDVYMKLLLDGMFTLHQQRLTQVSLQKFVLTSHHIVQMLERGTNVLL